MDKISKRHDKVAFMSMYDAPDVFVRMRGFTEFSVNKNPVEYSRKYIDEQNERNDVVGYSPSISYSFDRFEGDMVHDEIINITDFETVGADAVRTIVIVNMSEAEAAKGAYAREWSIIPDNEGNDKETYTYSGTFKSNGDVSYGTAESEDNWETCTFTKIDI